MQIAELRKEMGLSLESFSALIGLQSRGRMSVIERENRCALGVALRIERLSDGRIDAADLCEDVRLARHGVVDIADYDAVPHGNPRETSGEAA